MASILARLVRTVNILIAVVALSAAAVVYWLAWRPLPKTSGRISAPVTAAVRVSFDSLGVPHIEARSQEDALVAQGYLTAQERLWQMDGLRRFSAGDLAEVIGPAALESDRESRRLRLRRIAETAYVSMPAADRLLLAAYARGVNAFIRTHLRSLPLEFTLLRYEPRLWSAVDSILIGLHMYRTLTSTWRDEVLKRDMMAAGEPAKVNYLFPVRSGGESRPGSNAFALSGAHTASGKPLLANDMHLEWSVPGIWYMVHLQAPGLDVAGVSLPGVPGIIVGHNQRIAWGITNLQFDVQDLYIEKFDDRTGRYLYQGQTEQARAERELIRVKDRPPAEMVNWVTRHGPIFVALGDERLSLRWTATDPGTFQYPILQLDRAQNWSDFLAALARFSGPGSNFVYADVDGNIGYHAVGRLPIRKGFSGDVPVDGTSGNFEWQGFIPFEQLPSAFNPPQGVIVTANQNPFPPDYPYTVSGNFASHYRSSQIRALVASRSGLRPEDLIAVQKDVYSAFAHDLARSTVRAYEARQAHNPGLDDAIALLRNWNGQMDHAQAAPLIVTLAYQYLRKAVADRAAPGKGSLYEYQMAPAVIQKLLRDRPADWFQDYNELLLRCLSDGVEEGRRMQGRDVKRWRYGKYTELQIAHPVGHRLPLVSGWFDIGPVPMSGSSTSVKQTTRRLGPSMRMAADLADWEHSLLNVTVGQSGHVLSSHYRDEWTGYYYARSYPMQFGRVDSRDVLEMIPE